MFGMGFLEILIIGVIAILFLGPDKLPQTMVEIAKTFRSLKRTIATAKESLEEEIHISEIRKEAMDYKRELTAATSELTSLTSMDDISIELDDLKEEMKVRPDVISDSAAAKASTPPKPEEVTFKKKKKTPKKSSVQKEDEGELS